MSLVDAQARARALDPEGSFIVQAPAGSGKTGLLTQRFLRLLAVVDKPEQILAITFTRKAAAEMRGRIVEALAEAARGVVPVEPFERQRYELARGALAQDHAHGWQLLHNPQRLAVMTIDALSSRLTRQMPVLSGFGGSFERADEPEPLYQQAARSCLETSMQEPADSPRHQAVWRLLQHRDYDFQRLEQLLVEMLARRDQWIYHLQNQDGLQREVLEQALWHLVEGQLQGLAQRFDAHKRLQLVQLARYAAANLPDEGNASLRSWLDAQDFPGTAPHDLPLWRGLAELLVTADGAWRKRVDKNLGFPPASAFNNKEEQQQAQQQKTAHATLLEDLKRFQLTLNEALQGVKSMPTPGYGEAEWAVLEALGLVLKLAVAHLRWVFNKVSKVDFAEVSLQAVTALGTPDNPTDLTLVWDYKLRHLLVDEFQDTSQLQIKLLEGLTAGWSAEDGRTLFLVGDPMQSIYRFRKAEVALFAQVREQGLGSISVEPLQLEVNFRSNAGVVGWVNEAFEQLFPEQEDRDLGAVPYHHSVPFHGASHGVAVQWHPVQGGLDGALREAQQMVRIIEQTRQQNPQGSLAVLVRARPHLAALVPLLKAAGIPFQAVEIDALERRPVVQDLWSLSRALHQPADRIAWLALLRAPWCGLSPAQLVPLAEGQGSGTPLWQALQDKRRVEQLEPMAQGRLNRLVEVLQGALAQRGRVGLRQWIEGCWHALGGPATAGGAEGMQDASRYFALLEQLESRGEVVDWPALGGRLQRLYGAGAEAGPGVVQLMTIHKSKGLEFDTVILPGLNRPGKVSERPLLEMWERSHIHEWGGVERQLLVAPIPSAADEEAPLFAFLRRVQGEQERHEMRRLLYVATTRAKQHLHLLALLSEQDKDPKANLPLGMLWPTLSTMDPAEPGAPPPPPQAAQAPRPLWPQTLQRLADGWQPPPPPPAVAVLRDEGMAEPEGEPPRYDWAGEPARMAGIVTHEWLQIMAQQGVASWRPARVEALQGAIASRLVALGLAKNRIEETAQRVVQALKQALTTLLGRWILHDGHQEAACERELTGVLGGRLTRIVIDRTFVDEEGVRWIIDYKTSAHSGQDVDGFLDNEVVRYRQQLENYARILGALEQRPIHLGLYFPLLEGWRWWPAGQHQVSSRLPMRPGEQGRLFE
ncbi:DNA helicase/exodeoxyribonuclease V, subunit A [Magnetococcus marinus MC-1]|uniref:DNA 3'-5' helicase n=1 Tax=Magnetococcus marinus (strain ATCC BAA-1437 / JCM 17883 / MC-1) TaxID=156889 RepID=A0L698_MAGMM|nr:UvrD-helicase domain-containing protein [Magnetococcus marinus]ABK43491.1 DNA helicase/exodeoxyribonuclease V, subunit A [Magnetococcus marinus MC-1]